MTKCNKCFNPELPAKLQAEGCCLTFTHLKAPAEKIIVTFTCRHGATRRHSVYPNTPDSEWVETVLSATDFNVVSQVTQRKRYVFFRGPRLVARNHRMAIVASGKEANPPCPRNRS